MIHSLHHPWLITVAEHQEFSWTKLTATELDNGRFSQESMLDFPGQCSKLAAKFQTMAWGNIESLVKTVTLASLKFKVKTYYRYTRNRLLINLFHSAHFTIRNWSLFCFTLFKIYLINSFIWSSMPRYISCTQSASHVKTCHILSIQFSALENLVESAVGFVNTTLYWCKDAKHIISL